VNAQHVAGERERRLEALAMLLSGTMYADYQRVATTNAEGRGAADVHNLVTLSRFPIRAHREVPREPPALQYHLRTALPPAIEAQPVRFERPILVCEAELPDREPISVINLHLRAPLAANIPGQKIEPFVWKSVAGWAEGYFLAALQRTAQALELRLHLEQMFDAHDDQLIAIAGDFNAEDHEVPLRILLGAEESTGNPELCRRSLVALDRALPQDRRWSVLHHGRPQMLDHILVSHALLARFKAIDVHNETLSDELVGYARHAHAAGSFHAPVVAEFSESP
jgi:endonuclease/exonuclease/phosphatase family metal-dependent hydrolase